MMKNTIEHILRAPFIRKVALIVIVGAIVVFGPSVFGANDASFAIPVREGDHGFASTFLWIALILIVAKMSSLVERFRQPAVLGELVAGVVLGNLALIGISFFEPIKTNEIIQFLAELGVVILLFQIGLESNIHVMKRVGARAFLVAIVGVVAPFVVGAYILGPWLFPDLSSHAHLFVGAALTATSVGITARVFRDLGALQTKEAQIVLGAAVIDDVLGLIILAIVSALVVAGSVTVFIVGEIALKAVIFLVGSIGLGMMFAPYIGRAFSKIHPGIGMKFTIVISFGLLVAYLADRIGLAPIVGAFAAGLVLDPVHFSMFKNSKVIEDMTRCVDKYKDEKLKKEINHIAQHHTHRHVEELIEPIGLFLVPIFFILTGMQVNLESLMSPRTLLLALIITALAFAGKFVSGFLAGKVKKSIVGLGMVPRGEVGLIFATIGKSLGVISDDAFSVIVIMVILTTLLTPPLLAWAIRRFQKAELNISGEKNLISHGAVS